VRVTRKTPELAVPAWRHGSAGHDLRLPARVVVDQDALIFAPYALVAPLHQGELRPARGASLTPQWYLLLLLVKGSERGDERATVSELAQRMQLAQSTVTELVNRAERAGLVHRTASTLDGRVAHIALTKNGEERFAIAFCALADERRALREAVAEL
jgi:DNA-binding MarR family transcriptional regulator